MEKPRTYLYAISLYGRHHVVTAYAFDSAVFDEIDPPAIPLSRKCVEYLPSDKMVEHGVESAHSSQSSVELKHR